MGTFSITIENDGAFRAALSDRIRGLNRAARLAVEDSMDIIQTAIQDQLTTSTHPVGTPTPSAPGEPPSLVTGHLRGSVEQYGPFYDSPNSASGYVGPTAVQARIQELGGIIPNAFGNLLFVELPARPYVRPAVDEAKPRVAEAIRTRMADAVAGR